MSKLYFTMTPSPLCGNQFKKQWKDTHPETTVMHSRFQRRKVKMNGGAHTWIGRQATDQGIL